MPATAPAFAALLRGPLCVAARAQRTPRVGDWVSTTRTFDAQAVVAFARVTGDVNPIHLDSEHAAASMFGVPIVHGALVASLIPTCISSIFPGAIYRSQRIAFKNPVPIDSKVCARITVEKLVKLRRNHALLRCSTSCAFPDGAIALEGESEVLITLEPASHADAT